MGSDTLIIVVGRGHSGTRVISHTLYASGVFMGEQINPSGDMIPADSMYEAAAEFGRFVQWNGELEWDFDTAIATRRTEAFASRLGEYLRWFWQYPSPKGWKLPETLLALPWIIAEFPEAYYIYLVRDPRDCILGPHVTDDLARFNVDGLQANDTLTQRAISWYYQYQLVKATPKPDRWLQIRFEDFILYQGGELERLEEFLQIEMGRIVVKRSPVGRWRTSSEDVDFDFLRGPIEELGYVP